MHVVSNVQLIKWGQGMQTLPELSRRTLLGSIPTLGAAAILTGVLPVQAAPMQVPSMRAIHRFRIGSMSVTVIDDARITFPAPMFAVNQPEGTVVPFLKKYGLPTETVSVHMQITYIESGARKILLDTGMGDVTFPGNEPDNGRLLSGLSVIGVLPEDISDVILSHGHPDHIGSCSTDGVPLFKNARYHLPPNELEFWTQKPSDEQNFMNFMLSIGNAQLEPVRSSADLAHVILAHGLQLLVDREAYGIDPRQLREAAGGAEIQIRRGGRFTQTRQAVQRNDQATHGGYTRASARRSSSAISSAKRATRRSSSPSTMMRALGSVPL